MAQKMFEVLSLRIRFKKNKEVEITSVYNAVKKQLENNALKTEYSITSYSLKYIKGELQRSFYLRFYEPVSVNTINNMLKDMYGNEIDNIFFNVYRKEIIVEIC